jgi:membrane protein implicated in regulation of membrane protease activity
MKGPNSYQSFSVAYLVWFVLAAFFIGGIVVDWLGFVQVTWLKASNVSGLIFSLGGLIATKYVDRRLAKMQKEPKN